MKCNVKNKMAALLLSAGSCLSLSAQEIIVPITAADIFNRTLFNSTQPVMNTNGNNSWRYTSFWFWYRMVPPAIRSVSGTRFAQAGSGAATLPSEMLLWQLSSIGGVKAPFLRGDVLPDYQYFSTSDQNWYEPDSPSGGYNPGAVYFNFRITPDRFAANTFRAGDYFMNLTHNYTGGVYSVNFTPANMRLRLSVPAALSWIAEMPVRNFDITALDYFRISAPQGVALGTTTLATTVPFSLWASASPQITFVSSKGVRGTRNIGTITLSGADNRTITTPLSANWKNVTSAVIDPEPGNRTGFDLQLRAAPADLRRDFFEAGTYTFRLSLQAKASDNSVAATQNADFTVRVPPLSEVKIPAASRDVSFRFSTAADYQQGQSRRLPGHLVVSNNENFELYVRAGAPNLQSAGVNSSIPASVFEISLDGGGAVPLTTTPQKLLSNALPVLDKAFDVTYAIPAYAAQQLTSKERGQYTARVIYTFTAL